MTSRFRIAALAPGHDRSGFACGVEALDRYIAERAGQDVRRRVATCWVAHEVDSPVIAGFYTLAAGSVSLDGLPEAVGRRLPRYPSVPVARLGRLAIDRRHAGRGLGAALLWDAATRAARAELGIVAMLVDAKGEPAASFYRRHGFVPLRDEPLRLVLPLAGLTGFVRGA